MYYYIYFILFSEFLSRSIDIGRLRNHQAAPAAAAASIVRGQPAPVAAFAPSVRASQVSQGQAGRVGAFPSPARGSAVPVGGFAPRARGPAVPVGGFALRARGHQVRPGHAGPVGGFAAPVRVPQFRQGQAAPSGQRRRVSRFQRPNEVTDWNCQCGLPLIVKFSTTQWTVSRSLVVARDKQKENKIIVSL